MTPRLTSQQLLTLHQLLTDFRLERFPSERMDEHIVQCLKAVRTRFNARTDGVEKLAVHRTRRVIPKVTHFGVNV